ncbi:chemotaxis protein CheX [Treponema zuelzerae]|uniref:Chemotaxis protein CheX n=1 Tax=Teretinema zuelzerae TaxID=156 RepID=A0AAE3EGE4_9SPIR|nr:chemotaxis protein CheX [Teretinema zuelzerae]
MINRLVGELVNVIAAQASNKLEEYRIEISVPIVVQGQNHK